MATAPRRFFCMLFVLLIAAATSGVDATCTDDEDVDITACVMAEVATLTTLADDIGDTCNTTVIQDYCSTLDAIVTCMNDLDLSDDCDSDIPDEVDDLLTTLNIPCTFLAFFDACPDVDWDDDASTTPANNVGHGRLGSAASFLWMTSAVATYLASVWLSRA